MAQLKIDARDFKKAAAALEKHEFSALAGRTASTTLVKSANVVRRHVRTAARPHRRTGKMASRIGYRRSGSGMETVIKVRSGGPVAHLVAEGTKPHDIAPKNARALTIHVGGGVILRRGARHPGYRPSSNFFEDGVRAAEPEVQDVADAGAQAMARELAARMRR